MKIKKAVNKMLVTVTVCGECESDELSCYRDKNGSILSWCTECGAIESTKQIDEL